MIAPSPVAWHAPAPFGPSPEAGYQAGPKWRLSDLLSLPGYQALLLASSKDPNPKFSLLLILEGQHHPTLVVKAPATEVAEEAVRREGTLLRALHDLPLLTTGRTIPRALDSVDFHGRRGLLMSGLPGTPLSTSYHRWRHTA